METMTWNTHDSLKLSTICMMEFSVELFEVDDDYIQTIFIDLALFMSRYFILTPGEFPYTTGKAHLCSNLIPTLPIDVTCVWVEPELTRVPTCSYLTVNSTVYVSAVRWSESLACSTPPLMAEPFPPNAITLNTTDGNVSWLVSTCSIRSLIVQCM